METIEKYLINKNMKAANKGFYFLVQAIKLVKKDRTYLNAITKRLYPDIAKSNNETASKVERAIRHSIIIARLHLTNREFIARAVLDLKGVN